MPNNNHYHLQIVFDSQQGSFVAPATGPLLRPRSLSLRRLHLLCILFTAPAVRPHIDRNSLSIPHRTPVWNAAVPPSQFLFGYTRQEAGRVVADPSRDGGLADSSSVGRRGGHQSILGSLVCARHEECVVTGGRHVRVPRLPPLCTTGPKGASFIIRSARGATHRRIGIVLAATTARLADTAARRPRRDRRSRFLDHRWTCRFRDSTTWMGVGDDLAPRENAGGQHGWRNPYPRFCGPGGAANHWVGGGLTGSQVKPES